jgi:hypothetical protein
MSGCLSERNEAPVAPAAGDDGAMPAAIREEMERREAEMPDLAEWERLAAQPDGGVGALTADKTVVVVPAGSVDALQDAVDAAGSGGVVLLQEGMHTESGTVEINHRLTILGEKGAVLVSDVEATPPAASLEPALWIRDARRVTVWGLEMRSASPPGGGGILIQDSPNCVIAQSNLTVFQYPIVIEQGDHALVWGNTVAADLTVGGHGIVVVNGDRVTVADNDVTNGVFGIWACDERGFAFRNTCHGNVVGLILCKVPEAGLPLPDGSVVGAELPATRWLAKRNDTSGNFDTGLLVIDSANNNLCVGNTGTGNAVYDCELTADTYRFGFLTPAAYENTVFVPDPSYVVKDCGDDNTVFGGDQVDISADPCY